MGGFTTTIITNPLDIIRARLQVHNISLLHMHFNEIPTDFLSDFVFQVQRLDSINLAFRELWAEERLHMFFKGLSARLVQSAAFSFSIILGYETIKRISINDQYKHLVKW